MSRNLTKVDEPIYFTSDTHFYHRRILDFCPNRVFEDEYEMNTELVDRWNAKVSENAIVVFLGDFCWLNTNKKEMARELVRSLNGRIHFIEGNHDDVMYSLRNEFVSYSQIRTFKIKDDTFKSGWKSIECCHYCLDTWNKMHYGTWHIFGHSHGKHITPKNRLSMEVGIDCHKNMEPFSYDEIKQYMLNNKNVDIETGQLLPIMKRIGKWFNNY